MFRRYEVRAYANSGMTAMIVNAESPAEAAQIAEKKIRSMVNEKIISWAIIDRS